MSDPMNPAGDGPSLEPGPRPMTAEETTRLLDLSRSIRQTINTTDPASPYFGREDLRAAAETGIAVTLRRAGIEEVKADPATIAEQVHDRAFAAREMAPALAALCAERVEAAKDLSADDVARRADDLRREMGPKVYDRMLEAARGAFPRGVEPPKALRVDRYLLQLYSAQAAFQSAYEATRPKVPGR